MEGTPNEASKQRPETWVIAAVAAAALLCVTLVAVALAAILVRGGAGSGAPVNANPVITINTAPPSAPSNGIVRPSEPAKPQATRSSAQDIRQAALPGTQGKPGADQLERADPQARPDAAKRSLPSGDPKVFLRVRGDAPSLYRGQSALPMPVNYRADADGKVQAVYASRIPANKPLPPDQSYQVKSVSQAGVELQIQGARSTSSMDGYTAPEGFQFFTGKLRVQNKSANAIRVGADEIELHDQDGAVYLANPELSQGLPTSPLPAGESAEATISVLVGASSPLTSLALNSGQGSIVLPLARQ